MDAASFKTHLTTRGLTYSYYFSPTSNTFKPTLLFLHGFPSSSYDWRLQAAYFKNRGYGLLIPDMLGFGGTDKPADVESYRTSLTSKDLVELLDKEGIERVIAIGHDFGSRSASRLANYYPERIIACAFLAVSYVPPAPQFEVNAILELTKKTFGYELFGYWLFFSEDGADKVIEKHWDSFYSVLFPSDPGSWKTDLAPRGALKAYLEADKKGPLPPYVTEEDKSRQSQALLKDGISAALNLYKIQVSGVGPKDDESIPLERYTISKPVFFGAANFDYIALSALGQANVKKHCTDATIREFDAGHWVMLEKAGEVNKELENWVETVVERV